MKLAHDFVHTYKLSEWFGFFFFTAWYNKIETTNDQSVMRFSFCQCRFILCRMVQRRILEILFSLPSDFAQFNIKSKWFNQQHYMQLKGCHISALKYTLLNVWTWDHVYWLNVTYSPKWTILHNYLLHMEFKIQLPSSKR